MTRYYCPNCWNDFPENHSLCPVCGLDIEAFYEERDFFQKLIVALKNPEPETPVRAATILGMIGDRRAVAPLIEVLKKSCDYYIMRSIISALGMLGGKDARQVIEMYLCHRSVIVRKAALDAMKRLDSNKDKS